MRRLVRLLIGLTSIAILSALSACGGGGESAAAPGPGVSGNPGPGGNPGPVVPGIQPPPGAALDRSDPVSTDPGGLTFNATTRKLYFAVFGAGLLAEIDADTNEVTRTVAMSGGPIRAAVDPGTNTLYVCNIRDDTLAVIDGASLTVKATIPVGRTPRSVALIPALQAAYTANYLDGTVSVVDTLSNRALGVIDVGGFPRAIASDPSTHRVFVTNFKDDSVTMIDGDTNKVVATTPTESLPGYIHINPESHQVYVTCFGAATLNLLGGDGTAGVTVHVGGSPSGVQTSTALDRICVTSESGKSVWILRRSDNAALGQVPVEGVPQAVAIDSAGGRAYAADYAARKVFCIDIESRTVAKIIDLSRF